jgi:hypothetical protein
MAQKKKTAARKPRKKKTPKRFRFQLGFTGVAGIAVVMFCLFLWMFLLGIWAGQTILLPAPPPSSTQVDKKANKNKSPVKILRPAGKKSPVAHKK